VWTPKKVEKTQDWPKILSLKAIRRIRWSNCEMNGSPLDNDYLKHPKYELIKIKFCKIIEDEERVEKLSDRSF
jgi:hypothetical protein